MRLFAKLMKVQFKQFIREKAALLDEAPILCIACHWGTGAILFSGMNNRRYRITGATTLSLGDEASMLTRFREWADAACDPDTVLIGHHLLGFDLPRLRIRFAHHRLRLPHILDPTRDPLQPAADTMKLFARYFSVEHRDGYVSLDEVATKLGLPRTKPIINGADVPKLHKKGKAREILTYALLDALTTTRAYQLLTGQAGDLQ